MEPATIAAIASVAGGVLSNLFGKSQADKNIALQREFAQQGVRWKVADAKAAGIHPLYALGASTTSYSPVVVQDQLGPAMASAGQDISRSMIATKTAQERNDAEATAFMLAREREADERLRLQRAEDRANVQLMSNLANDEAQRALWYSQVRRNEQQVGPPMADAGGVGTSQDSRGTVDTGRIKLESARQTSRDPSRSSALAGSQPMFQRVETAPGVFRDFPNPDLNVDSDLLYAILAGQAYVDKWVQDVFFGGAPKYIQVKPRYEPSPGSFMMDRGYQRPGVNRRGR